MLKHIVFRIIAGLVLLAAIAGLGFFAYQAGVAHGVAANIQVSGTQVAGSSESFHRMAYGHFMGFPGIGIFGLLFVFFLLCLAFGAMRRLIWGPRWGMRHMGHGRMGQGPWSEGVPPMFAEMHRKMHATPGWDKAPDGDKTSEPSEK